MITRADVVRESREWIDTRYKHLGRLKKHGVDCAGLVICVAQNLGLYDTVEVKKYSRLPDSVMMKNYLDLYLKRIEISDVGEGDILFMRFACDHPQHLAIISKYDNGIKKIIHAYSQVQRCSEHDYDDLWRKRTVSAYRYKGVE